MPLGDALGAALGVLGQIPDRGQDTLIFVRGLVLGSQRIADGLERRLEDRPVTFRVKREAVLVVLYVEGPALSSQTEVALLEDLAKEIPEKGKQDAAPVLGAGWS